MFEWNPLFESFFATILFINPFHLINDWVHIKWKTHYVLEYFLCKYGNGVLIFLLFTAYESNEMSFGRDIAYEQGRCQQYRLSKWRWVSSNMQVQKIFAILVVHKLLFDPMIKMGVLFPQIYSSVNWNRPSFCVLNHTNPRVTEE